MNALLNRSVLSDSDLQKFHYIADRYLIVGKNKELFYKTIHEFFEIFQSGSWWFDEDSVRQIADTVDDENRRILFEFCNLSGFKKNISDAYIELYDKYLYPNLKKEIENLMASCINMWATESRYLKAGQAIIFYDLL